MIKVVSGCRDGVAVVVCSLLMLCSGCMTADMWGDANYPTVCQAGSVSRVVGEGGRRWLQVGYSCSADLYIPIESDGRAGWPFGYRGKSTDVVAALKDVDEGQRAAIFDAVKKQEYWNPPKGLGAVQMQGDAYVLQKKFFEFTAVFYLPLTADGKPNLSVEAFAKSINDGVIPSGTIVVLTPQSCPRPVRQLDAAQGRAALLTPVTVAGDVVCDSLAAALLPILLIYVACGGRFCC